jgi:hypothetical protein
VPGTGLGVVAVVVAALAFTGNQSSPTTTAAPTTTIAQSAATAAVTTTGASSTSTIGTTTTLAFDWRATLTEPFTPSDPSSSGWLIGGYSDEFGSQTYQLTDGTYELSLNLSSGDRAYWYMVDFIPGSSIHYTRISALAAGEGTGCGLAFRTRDQSVLNITLLPSAGQAEVELFREGVSIYLQTFDRVAAPGAWHEVALWADGDNGRVFIDTQEVGTFIEALLPEVEAVGVAINHAAVGSCTFDNLEAFIK